MWIDEIRSVAAKRGESLAMAANPADASYADRRAWSQMNIDGIRAAVIFWLFAPSTATPSQGAFFEFGLACQLGAQTIASGGDHAPIFIAMAQHIHATDNEAFGWLKRRRVPLSTAIEYGWTSDAPWIKP